MNVLLPPGWARPRGYSHGVAASGKTVMVAGQVGWNAQEKFETDDFNGQVRFALENIKLVLAEAGAEPKHMVRMNWFVTSKAEYMADQKGLGAIYREIMGDNYPAMTAIEVKGLMASQSKVEIEVTAIVPE